MTAQPALQTPPPAIDADIISRAYVGLQQGQTDWAQTQGLRDAVDNTLAALDAGSLRVAHHTGQGWQTQDWVKQAILLSFRLNAAAPMQAGPHFQFFDKVPLKTEGWDAAMFEAASLRMVPGAIVRRGAYIGRNCVLMPCFVNIGAYVGDGTMVDTWATIGSCAQIGKQVHISGGVGIGGVLEPLQALPVIIEDHAFIGARSEIAEGVHIGEGAVIAMGTFISASTRIIDRQTGQVHMGKVPPYAVVVPGTMPATHGGPSLACAVIVKTVDARTRAKTGINELLRSE